MLIKMERSSLVNRDLSPGTRVEGIIRVVTPTTYLWKHVTLEQGLQWDKYRRQGVGRFYIWDDLGHGMDGRALFWLLRHEALFVFSSSSSRKRKKMACK
jgi:hypothetical protein